MAPEDHTPPLLAYYDALFARHGNDVRSLGWSAEGQQTRFAQAAAVLPAETRTLLDIGCGLGDLRDYLGKIRPGIAYTGWDINPRFIAACRARDAAAFHERDIVTSPPAADQFDAVVSIGALNTKAGDNEALVRTMIERMFAAARLVAVFSGTSIHVDPEYRQDAQGMYYYDPAELFRFARSIAKKVDLLHSYLPHDFMLVLKK